MLDNPTVPSSKPSPHPSAEQPPMSMGLRERKKARTRAELQQHALRLFAERGYHQTTVEQIAAAADVSPSTFFRYYPTKEDTVWSDFMDNRVIAFVREAPARLSPIAAFRYAVEKMADSMTVEEMALEVERNALISTVPELQRGLLEEMLRPMRLLADVLAERLNRPAGDQLCGAYAGAMVGGLLAAFGTEAADLGYLTRLSEGIGVLEQILKTPPRG
ncbi:MAG: TetR family transcriptional regulator [Streptosporangiaceae bacterium]